ncbi:MAG TPA: PASTA domain-containing protein [Candidatus Acidoferrales bacterium]|nr:PASTA domain-containing protein [Candidatus Acidoferrales bacterium]
MNFKDRIQWLLRMSVLVFVLAAAAFLSAITTMRIAIRGRQVSMPAIVGLKTADAQKLLASNGLGMKISDKVYDAAPVGNVVRQSPAGRAQLKSGQDAHVIVSLGPLRVPIPDLEGQTVRVARITLMQNGLQPGEVTAPYLDTAAPDTVVEQDPKPGANASSPHVDLLAPLGPRQPAFIMPYVIGLNSTDAQRPFLLAGLHNVKATPTPAPQWPVGTVIDQTPLAGTRVSADSTIELKVAFPAPPPVNPAPVPPIHQ